MLKNVQRICISKAIKNQQKQNKRGKDLEINEFISSFSLCRRKEESFIIIYHPLFFFFMKKKHNGEYVTREWLLYSPSVGAVFCFVCKLFSDSTSSFSRSGFSDWRHATQCTESHESSELHQCAMVTYCSLLSTRGRPSSRYGTRTSVFRRD